MSSTPVDLHSATHVRLDPAPQPTPDVLFKVVESALLIMSEPHTLNNKPKATQLNFYETVAQLATQEIGAARQAQKVDLLYKFCLFVPESKLHSADTLFLEQSHSLISQYASLLRQYSPNDAGLAIYQNKENTPIQFYSIVSAIRIMMQYHFQYPVKLSTEGMIYRSPDLNFIAKLTTDRAIHLYISYDELYQGKRTKISKVFSVATAQFAMMKEPQLFPEGSPGQARNISRARRSLLREIKALERINQKGPNSHLQASPFIVVTKSASSNLPDFLAYVGPLYGDNLKVWLNSSVNISPQKKVDYCTQLVNGYLLVAELNMVHGDLQVTNVCVQSTADGECLRITDWENGMSHDLGSGEKASLPGITPLSSNYTDYDAMYNAYASANHEALGPLVRRHDLYALGTVFFYILWEDYPYKRTDFVSYNKRNKTFLFPRKDAPINKEAMQKFAYPSQLTDFICRMVCQDPTQRPTLEELKKQWAELTKSS